MRYLLDTNICIYIIKKRPAEVLKRFSKLEPGSVGISTITQFELLYGAHKSEAEVKNLDLLERFFLPLELSPFESSAAEESARIRVELKHYPIGPMDLLIAVQARALGVTLVTNNTREFSRVEGLRIENWVMRRV